MHRPISRAKGLSVNATLEKNMTPAHTVDKTPGTDRTRRTAGPGRSG